ncbi:hypothetical protein EX30DRAFT_107855 [Ascodesmis nigricans]|uniref:Transmembrane protein n=1 Tax=Ascodesmis nigricans TaxID=341454 RepID=A0A4S2MQR8_9PEZI|nr:hypothetical protein EX30DRAFT_107855 [Ascodesmis nigricans]
MPPQHASHVNAFKLISYPLKFRPWPGSFFSILFFFLLSLFVSCPPLNVPHLFPDRRSRSRLLQPGLQIAHTHGGRISRMVGFKTSLQAGLVFFPFLFFGTLGILGLELGLHGLEGGKFIVD